jgi:hypothetical protein
MVTRRAWCGGAFGVVGRREKRSGHAKSLWLGDVRQLLRRHAASAFGDWLKLSAARVRTISSRPRAREAVANARSATLRA